MLFDIWTVFWRDWIVLKRRMVKFILSRMVAPTLYLVAFGWGLGRSIQVDSGTYLDFLVPGILALNSMNISFNSITPVHTERLFFKSLEEYLISPINPDSYVIGKMLAPIFRGLISSAIILVMAWLFGADLTITPLFLVILILNCLVFAEIGFLAAMKISSHEEMSQVNTYILLPMSFLCGTFFKTSTMPDVFRWFIEFLPLTHTSYLLRGIAQSQPVAMESVAVLVIYAILGFLLSRKALGGLTR
ncbi:MAG: ABC transporter permease [Selenomonadales bacterium]|nr:ABC transporter permease [Selenomonadales bacterium]MDD6218130.1 ABC transporter permease [Selenomonadaceae bacterium]